MFINLKDLKANIGSPIKLTLHSEPVFVEKEWQGRSFNVFNYRVLMNGNDSELSATDSLKRKIDSELKVGDDFLLSWEEFTKDGQMRNYWKIQKLSNETQYENIKQPVSNGVANGVNEFEQKLQESKAEQAVVKTNKEYVSPARNGMIFNNTIKLYIANDMAWTQDEFVSNYKRVESFLDSCENAQETKPFELPVEKPVQPKVAPSATYTADDLPF
jgi:hypothetical protein